MYAGNGHNTEAGSNPSIASIPPQLSYRRECTMIYADDWTKIYRAYPAPNPHETPKAKKGRDEDVCHNKCYPRIRGFSEDNGGAE